MSRRSGTYWKRHRRGVRNGLLRVRSGSHPKGPSGPAMDAAVMSFHLSLSPTSSSSLTRFRPVVKPYTSSFQILFYIVYPPLLWASNRSFSCWLPIMNFGWPPLFVHSGDICPYHFILLFRTVFSAISCPGLTRPYPPLRWT